MNNANNAGEKNTLTILIVISIVSKIMGFLRDIVLAFFWGASTVSDSFIISTTLPFTLCDVLIQAIAVGFIPIYAKVKNKSDVVAANRFANNFIELLLILSIPIILLGLMFPNIIVKIFASGFDSAAVNITSIFIRITIFSIVFKVMTSILSGLMQSNQKFVVPAMIGLPYDIVIIIGIALSKVMGIYVLPISVVIAGIVQVLILLFFSRKIGYNLKFEKSILTPEIKQVFKLLIPLLIIVGVNQINVIVDKTFASYVSNGAITILDYANKFCLVIENVIVYSIVAVLYPALSDCSARKDYDSFAMNINKASRKIIVFLLPVTILLIFHSDNIIKIILGHGAYSSDSVSATAICMKFYSIGIIAIALKTIYIRALYSLEKVKDVTIISIVSLFLNLILNYVFLNLMGIGGLALATSISTITTIFFFHYKLKQNKINIKICDFKSLKSSIFVSTIIILFIMIFNMFTHHNNSIVYSIISLTVSGLIYLLFIYLERKKGDV